MLQGVGVILVASKNHKRKSQSNCQPTGYAHRSLVYMLYKVSQMDLEMSSGNYFGFY